jgi:hypothetical protein
MNDWKPIETAPRDGTLILLYGRTHDEKWNVCSWFMEEDAEGNEVTGWYNWDWEYYEPPTHWMELPEAPK